MEDIEETGDIEYLIGIGAFRMKEEKIREQIMELIYGLDNDEIESRKIIELTKSIKVNISDEIIKDRERL